MQAVSMAKVIKNLGRIGLLLLVSSVVISEARKCYICATMPGVPTSNCGNMKDAEKKKALLQECPPSANDHCFAAYAKGKDKDGEKIIETRNCIANSADTKVGCKSDKRTEGGIEYQVKECICNDKDGCNDMDLSGAAGLSNFNLLQLSAIAIVLAAKFTM